MVSDRRVRTLLLLVALAACAGPQAALDPTGPSAAAIDRLGNAMVVGAALVTLMVVVLVLVPVVRKRHRRIRPSVFLWSGVVLPLVTLTVLVPYVFTVGRGMPASTARDRISVDITGHQFWWAVAYRRGDAHD